MRSQWCDLLRCAILVFFLLLLKNVTLEADNVVRSTEICDIGLYGCPKNKFDNFWTPVLREGYIFGLPGFEWWKQPSGHSKGVPKKQLNPKKNLWKLNNTCKIMRKLI